MTDRSYTSTLRVAKTPAEAFAAITNVRAWWSADIEGSSDRIGAEFIHHFRDIHRCKIRVTELVPGRRVAWRVLENHFNFTKDEREWVDTEIVFDISRQGEETEVRLTHHGLVPEYECFDICSDGWTHYMNGSLRDLIVTGRGQPNVGEALTESERALAN